MTAVPGRPRLIGRDADLADVSKAMSEAAAGTFKVVVVEGEPGIGKSRLIAEAIDAGGDPFRVLYGQGHELERERPFGVIADACEIFAGDASRKAIADLLTGDSAKLVSDGRADFAELRFRIVEAFLGLLADWSASSPLLLVVEDMHWADPSTVLVLDQAIRRLQGRPIAVIASLRPSPRSASFDQLRRGLSAEDSAYLRLGPLGGDAVRELAASLAGGCVGPRLHKVVSGASGNPFFITEIVAALRDDGRLLVDREQAETTSATTPATARATVLHRLGFLPPACLDTLRMAAVVSSRFRLDDLSVVLGRPASELLESLDDALATGLLVESEHAFAFRHHLVWDAVYQDMPLASREALHLQVARRLAEANRPVEQVATHFLAGAAPGDRQALEWLEQAGREAASRAPGIAAELLRGALELTNPGDHDLRYRLSVVLATSLTWAGRLDEAEPLLEDLVAHRSGTAADTDVLLGLGRLQIIQGKPVPAAENLDAVLNTGALSGRDHALALADQSMAHLLSGDVDGAAEAAASALDAARRVDDAPALCGALASTCWVENLRGHTLKAVELGEEAVALADANPDSEAGRRYPHAFLATVLMDTDRLDDGRRMYHIGQRYAERFGATWLLPVHHLGEALAAFHAGQYDDALAALSTGEQVVAEVGTMTLAVWACSLGAHIAIDRDDLATATDRLAAAEQHLRDAGPGLGYDWLLWGQARLLEASGDIAGAAHALSAAWEMAAMLGLISQRRLIGPDLVSLLMAGGERDQARRIALALAEAAELSGGVPSLKATALRCQGVVDGDPVVIERAVAIAAACPQRVQYARTCEDAGHVMIKTGEEDRARELFTTAADVYHQATATRGERRVDAKLRELGVARGRRERRSRPTTGWDALTPTELKVSRMAAEGLTNPEIGRRLFISPRTVETHLSHVYAKLGMTSRVELAMVVAQRSQ